VAAEWWPCASTNAFRVDEFVGTVSQGSACRATLG